MRQAGRGSRVGVAGNRADILGDFPEFVHAASRNSPRHGRPCAMDAFRAVMLPPDLSLLLGPHFGFTGKDSLRVEKIEKGGSDREFHRLWLKGEGRSFILVTYGTARPENARYADIASFLFARGIAVPEVQCHEPGHGVLVMEDL